MISIAQAIYHEAEQLPDEALARLLVMAIRMLAARGAATEEQLRILEQLEGADMSVQLSFDGQHNMEADPLVGLLKQVRRAEVGGELWLSAVELANAAKGGSRAPRQYWHSVKRRIEEEDETVLDESSHILRIVPMPDALGRLQNNDMLNEQGCYRVLMAIPGKTAARVRKWMAQQIQEHRMTKGLRKPQSVTEYEEDVDIVALEHILSFMRRISTENQEIKRRLGALEETVKVKQEEIELPLLPAPTVQAPEKSARAALNELVRSAARRRDAPYHTLWNQLYHELKYRIGFDVEARAANSGMERLDIIEAEDHMDELYAIACEIL